MRDVVTNESISKSLWVYVYRIVNPSVEFAAGPLSCHSDFSTSTFTVSRSDK